METTQTTSGDVWAGFQSKLRHFSLEHGTVLEEQWDVKAYDLEDYHFVDLQSTLKNTSQDTLYINKYHYGGLGIRGSKHWNKVDSTNFVNKAQFLTSEGKTRIAANHSRPKWTAMYGKIEEGIAGVAVLDHPANFRHPQPVRVHPEMPYFCLAPMVEAAMYIAPGQQYESNFRLVTFDGEADPELLDRLWEDYAEPVVGVR